MWPSSSRPTATGSSLSPAISTTPCTCSTGRRRTRRSAPSEAPALSPPASRRAADTRAHHRRQGRKGATGSLTFTARHGTRSARWTAARRRGRGDQEQMVGVCHVRRETRQVLAAVSPGRRDSGYGKKGSSGLPENSRFSPVTSPCDVMSICWMPPRGNEIVPGGGSALVAGTRDGGTFYSLSPTRPRGSSAPASSRRTTRDQRSPSSPAGA